MNKTKKTKNRPRNVVLGLDIQASALAKAKILASTRGCGCGQTLGIETKLNRKPCYACFVLHQKLVFYSVQVDLNTRCGSIIINFFHYDLRKPFFSARIVNI